MKNFSWKKLLPHLIAIIIFLVVAMVYCKPALQGQVLEQTDIVHWRGMAQSAFDYKEQHGHFPLWNTHLFSGMPNYQVYLYGKSFLIDFNKVFTLGLPKPISYFFLACICFYILCVTLGTNYIIGILGSLAFAYCSYDPVIISVGHESKMMAIAYMPALLAGLILLYERRYVIGLCLTALFATMEISANHPQINYYFIIVAGFMTLAYIIKWVQSAQWKHMAIALSLALIGGGIGVGNAAITLLTTAEYSKYTIRGGKTLENTGTTLKDVKTTGLDLDYAFSYSLGKIEAANLMLPNAFGGSGGERLNENSNIVSALTARGVPEENAVQLVQYLPKYWGGIGGPAGPVYLGAIICVLFVIGLVVVKNEHKWWILAAAAFSIFMAWGSYFLSFNELLFKYLPLYNKFRAPSMALVIPQLLFPILAVLCLQKIFIIDTPEQLQKSFKKILYAVGALFAVLLLIYIGNDYLSPNDDSIKSMLSQITGNNQDISTVVFNGLLADRKAMFGADLARAFIFALVTLAALFLYARKLVKPVYLIILLLIVNTGDLLAVDSKYLNASNYEEPDNYQVNFSPTIAEQQIMKDTSPHYRVYNLAPDRFQESLTAYYLRCIGGYHPAKLSIYQDLIENQISKGNMHVLNMLDTKYFIIPPQQQNQAQAAAQATVQRNASALGACWFVRDIKFVNGPAEEMKALDNFDPAQTAIVENSFKSLINNASATDSSATIQLLSYDPDDIKYTSQSNTNRFAVFSEIYYPAGWNAYIDGKKVDYCKVNYALRGLSIPAGKHSIEFKFEPSSYYTGQTLVYIASIALWLCIIAALLYWWRKNQHTQNTTTT
ncbi:hypothetical protein FC093_09540 [Ilyomonas limi]|uniref:YfhO family protein n=1 Tax=Ilyomonas limi TaxID=2575867 RepID=A0A4U3L5M6_9BACT|nr:YfhO family protein [Ilyomonas limi]TKK68927.1 hypothetical protein FC093_09540 [Ilyomonas limi]